MIRRSGAVVALLILAALLPAPLFAAAPVVQRWDALLSTPPSLDRVQPPPYNVSWSGSLGLGQYLEYSFVESALEAVDAAVPTDAMVASVRWNMDDLTGWTLSIAGSQSSVVYYSAPYSLKHADSDTSTNLFDKSPAVTVTYPCFVEAYIYVESSNGYYICVDVYTSTGYRMGALVLGDGAGNLTIGYWDGGGRVNGPETYATGVWYRVVLELGASTWNVSVYVASNETLVYRRTGLTYINAPTSSIQVYLTTGALEQDVVYLDDVAVYEPSFKIVVADREFEYWVYNSTGLAASGVATGEVYIDEDPRTVTSVNLSIHYKQLSTLPAWYPQNESIISEYPGTPQLLVKYAPRLYEKLTITVDSLQGNDTIAPHLYDWQFDGEDDCVGVLSFNSVTSFPFAVEALINLPVYNQGWNGIVDWNRDSAKGFWLMTSAANNKLIAGTGNGTLISEYYQLMDGYENKWVHIAVNYGTNYFDVYMDAENVKTLSLTFTPSIPVSENLFIGARGIGSYLVRGYIAFVRIYDRDLTVEEINDSYSKHIISNNGLALFLDPTFWNGTYYIDLSENGNNGTPYGDVQRVMAENKFLYCVKGLASDGLVHFKWFPVNTVVVVKDSGGNVVKEFVITGTPANDDGQVEDYAVSISPLSNAVIEAYVPTGRGLYIRFYDGSSYSATPFSERVQWLCVTEYDNRSLTMSRTVCSLVLYTDAPGEWKRVEVRGSGYACDAGGVCVAVSPGANLIRGAALLKNGSNVIMPIYDGDRVILSPGDTLYSFTVYDYAGMDSYEVRWGGEWVVCRTNTSSFTVALNYSWLYQFYARSGSECRSVGFIAADDDTTKELVIGVATPAGKRLAPGLTYSVEHNETARSITVTVAGEYNFTCRILVYKLEGGNKTLVATYDSQLPAMYHSFTYYYSTDPFFEIDIEAIDAETGEEVDRTLYTGHGLPPAPSVPGMNTTLAAFIDRLVGKLPPELSAVGAVNLVTMVLAVLALVVLAIPGLWEVGCFAAAAIIYFMKYFAGASFWGDNVVGFILVVAGLMGLLWRARGSE